MSYATTADAVKFVSAQRLAEITGYTAGVNVSTDSSFLPIDLFRDAALGNDLSGYTAQQQVDVAKALEVLQVALDSATSLIDSYVIKKYPLPLITYPDWFKEACVSFANCSLHDDKDIESISNRCKHYQELLEDVASGKVRLYPASDETENVSNQPNIVVSAPQRVFTQSLLDKMI